MIYGLGRLKIYEDFVGFAGLGPSNHKGPSTPNSAFFCVMVQGGDTISS